MRGDPGPRLRGRGRAPRREALFHFPASLRFLRSVSLTSLNFTALGLRPPGSAPGRKRVLGSGSLPRPRGGPSRQGAGQARGAQTLQGRPACEPRDPWFRGTLREGGLGCPDPKGGVCFGAPGPAPFPDSWARRTSLLLLPECCGAVWWGALLEEGIRAAESDTSLGAPVALPNLPPSPRSASPGGGVVPSSPEAGSSTETSGR